MISLTVTGYSYFSDVLSNRLVTHSNVYDEIKDKGIFYDIDTIEGQSGSPVYATEISSRLVGIHKGF